MKCENFNQDFTKAFEHKLNEICSKWGYDLEVIPAVLGCSSEILKTLSDLVWEVVK